MIGLFVLAAAAASRPDPRCAARVGFVPLPAGVVSSSRIAAQVAKIYLDRIYGVETIAREMPFKVELAREVWHVSGVLPKPGFMKVAIGGVAEAYICQSTGEVLYIAHGK